MKNLCIVLSLIFLFSCSESTKVEKSTGSLTLFFQKYSNRNILYKIDIDSKKETIVIDDAENIDSYNISPDRKKIAYLSKEDGDYDIYIVDIDGNNKRKLLNNDVHEYYPVWSPDGRQIAFCSNDYEESTEICIIDVNGENLKRLTNNSLREKRPVWSPDGTYLLFNSIDYKYNIIKIDTNGNNEIQLFEHGYRPNFSYDGTKIIFFSSEDDFINIFIMNTDGSNLTQLTNEPYEQRFAYASPTEDLILFTSLFESDVAENEYHYLSIMKFDGSNRQVLTPENEDCEVAVWSGEGQKIAYQHLFYDSTDEEYKSDLYIMDKNGQNKIKLTNSDPSGYDGYYNLHLLEIKK